MGTGDQASATDEIEVLFPDVEVGVQDPDSGIKLVVTVREFRFAESLRARPAARPLVEALAALGREARDEGREAPGAAALEAIMGAHHEAWLELLARATGRDAEWLARLGDEDGARLSWAMWETNGPFFVRLAVSEIAGREGAETLFASLASSATSSGQDTASGTRTSRSG